MFARDGYGEKEKKRREKKDQERGAVERLIVFLTQQ
jgi:hypothetical protein